MHTSIIKHSQVDTLHIHVLNCIARQDKKIINESRKVEEISKKIQETMLQWHGHVVTAKSGTQYYIIWEGGRCEGKCKGAGGEDDQRE